MNGSTKRTLALTAAQRAVWFAQELDGAVGAHVTAEYVVLPAVQRIRFEAALRRVLLETPQLHAHFRVGGAGPVQVLPRSTDDQLASGELGHAQFDGWRSAMSWMAHRATIDFDLAHGPIVEHVLVKVGQGELAWFARSHDLVLDAVGFDLIRRAVAQAYDSMTAGSGVGWRPDWQADDLDEVVRTGAGETRAARNLEYWRALWADRRGLVSPADRPFEVVTNRGGTQRATVSLDSELCASLAGSCAREQVFASSLFIAAVAQVVAERTGRSDLLVRMPVAGRSTARARRVPTRLTTELPIRVRDARHATPAAVSQSVLEGLRHQSADIAELNRDLGLLDEGWRPIGPRVNMTTFDEPLTFGGAAAKVCSVSNGAVDDWSLTVYATDPDGSRRVDLELAPGRYPAGVAASDLVAVEQCLRRLVAAPAEVDHSSGPVPDAHTTILSVLERTVRARPDAAAVSDAATSLTFKQLWERAGMVADVLAAQGVGLGDVVACACPRGTDLLVGLFGTLRSGAAYCPLAIEHPPRRLREILEVADARFALCTTTTPDHVANVLHDLPRLDVDSLTATVGNLKTRPPAGPGPRGDDAAYLVFTSGSTGVPRPVVVEHRSLANLLTGLIRRVHSITERAAGRPLRAALLAPVGFDAAWTQVLWLVAGHELFVVDNDTRRDPAALVALTRRERLDVVHLTPTLAAEVIAAGLLEAARGEHRPALLCLGGEDVPPELWDAVRGSGVRAINMYGPTECTVDSAVAEVVGVKPVIGTAVDGARAYVLDREGQPVATGQVGELFVGGAGVSRGYAKAPGLTALRFVPDPFAGDGSRMYRTGDRVRVLDRTTLQFVGRVDRQIKIRGNRVEPAEVETALRSVPLVADAAVTVRRRADTGNQLVAFVCLRAGVRADAAAVRAELEQRVPDYLVPPWIEIVPSLPTTERGKIDLAALHALPVPTEPARPVNGGPRRWSSPEVAAVAGIYESVLGQAGLEDSADFFELGGDSMSALRVLSLVERQFGVRPALRTLFDGPSVSEFAAAVVASAAARSIPRL